MRYRAVVTLVAFWNCAAFAAEVKISSTPPGATVFVDAKYAGVTPLTKPDLPPGEHQLKLVRHGYKAWQKAITVAEQPSAVEATLEAIPSGTLKITSQPTGADVYLDGELAGQTPLTLENLEPAEYEVRVQKANFAPVTRRVELAKGAAPEEKFQLTLRTEQYYLAEIERQPDKLAPYTELAHYYMLKDDVDKAMETFHKAVEACSGGKRVDSSEARDLLKELGNVYSAQFEYGDTKTQKLVRERLRGVIEEAIEKTSAASYAYRSLALLYTRITPREKVIELCERAVQRDPRSPRFRELGDVYLERGEAADAVALLERAAKLEPGSFDTTFSLATAYHRAGQLDKAEATYEAAAKLNPPEASKASLHQMRGRLYLSKGDLDKSVLAWKDAIAASVEPHELATNSLQLADMLAMQKKFDEAEKLCKDLIATSNNFYIAGRAKHELDHIAALRKAAEKK